MSLAYADEARHIRDVAPLSDRDIARATGAVPVWLNKPVGALDHRKPLDVLAEGGYETVSRLVAEVESPTFG